MADLQTMDALGLLLPAALKLLFRASRRLNTRAKIHGEINRLMADSIQVLGREDPQHEAVGALIGAAIGRSPGEGHEGVLGTNPFAELVRHVKADPSYPSVAEMRLLDDDVLDRCLRRWYGIVLEFLPEYPMVCRAISLSAAQPAVVLQALTEQQAPDPGNAHFAVGSAAFAHPSIRELRKSTLQGISALVECGKADAALEQAETLLRDTILTEEAPENRFVAGLHLLAAQALFSKRVFAEAGCHVEEAARILPEDKSISLNTVQVLAATGEVEEAQTLFDSLPTSIKESALGRFAESYIHMERGRFEEAISLLGTLLADKDPIPEGIANLALCYTQIGLHDRAKEAARQAIDLSKGAARYYVTLGDVCFGEIMRQLHSHASSTVHRESAESTVGFTARDVTMRVLAENRETVREGINAYETAARHLPDVLKEEKFLTNLGQFCLFAGDYKRACELLASAVQVASLYPPLIPLIDARIASGDYGGATDALDEAELMYPDSLVPELAKKRIEILYLKGEYREAVSHLTALVDRGGASLDTHWNRAKCFDKLGKPLQAVEDFEKAIQLGADREHGLREITHVYLSHGMKGSAIRVLEQLASERCIDWSVYRELATLLIGTGNPLKALEVLLSYPRDSKETLEQLWFLGHAQFASAQYKAALATLEEIEERFKDKLIPSQTQDLTRNIHACQSLLRAILPPNGTIRFILPPSLS